MRLVILAATRDQIFPSCLSTIKLNHKSQVQGFLKNTRSVYVYAVFLPLLYL